MLLKPFPYHVYIVKCSDGTYYTGITNDLERRLLQHNGGMRGGARYTSSRGPVELLYVKKYKTRSEASKVEYHIKTLNHQQKLDLINSVSKEDILNSI